MSLTCLCNQTVMSCFHVKQELLNPKIGENSFSHISENRTEGVGRLSPQRVENQK